MSRSDYRESGVDIDAGNEAVRRIARLARQTYTPGVLGGVGAFGGLFALDGRVQDPVLVASADGVGTKLKVAFRAGVHDTIGVDLVNHCVNDILVQGARPLFFLDYLATGRLAPDIVEQIVRGIAQACRENECALLGGETAEMPGFYADGEYDVAGFIVGVVPKARVLPTPDIVAGDTLTALPSTGLHTNGYSLARKIAFDVLGLEIDSRVEELGQTVGDALLAPHRSYLKAVLPALDRGWIKGMAHVTGGGIVENLPRTLPQGRSFVVDRASWQVPPIFGWLQRAGDIDDAEMLRTFNMGVGLILICAADRADDLLRLLKDGGEAPWTLGRIV